MISQVPKLTPDDREFWRVGIAEFLVFNDGKMDLEDLDLPPLGNHGGLGRFFQVIGECAYKHEFAHIVAEENTKRTGEPWIVFDCCEGGAYMPTFLQRPTAMLYAEANDFIKSYEPRVRKIRNGGYDKLNYTIYYRRDNNEVCSSNDCYDIGDGKKVSGLYNVRLAETNYYHSHPEIHNSFKPDGDTAADKERDYMADFEEIVVEEQINLKDILPDPTISIADMNDYGYTANELLPLSQARALELFDKDKIVYLLYHDNTETMVFDRDEIERFDGIFGIDRTDWEKTLSADKCENEKALEAYFLGNEGRSVGRVVSNSIPPLVTKTNMIAIYQVRDDIENVLDMRFVTFDELKARDAEPSRSNYMLVYIAPFSERVEFLTDRPAILNRLYEQFNTDHPADYEGHSVSVSDVVVLRYNGDMAVYYVDDFGFVEIDSNDFYGGGQREFEN